MTDLYETLGVDPTADPTTIKAAYRRKAKAAHPDAGGDPEKFGALAKAYDVLRDDQKRARYDATGETEFPPDRSREETLALLDGYLDRVLKGGDVHDDLARAMRGMVHQEQADIRSSLKQGAAIVARLEDMARRFVTKDKVDVVGMLIERRLKTFAGLKAKAEADLAVRDKVLEVLAEIEFRAEPRPTPAGFGFAKTTSAATFG